MEGEKQEKNAKQLLPNSENSTIFDALVEIMVKNKEEKDPRLRRFLRKLRIE